MQSQNLITGYNGIGEMLVPDPWRGPAPQVPFDDYQWVKMLPGRVWCRLFEKMPSQDGDVDLPDDYDMYVISFHLESADIAWIDLMASKIDRPIIILVDAFRIQYPTAANISLHSYVYWHRQLDRAMSWYDQKARPAKDIRYKASALCNRITQSKLLITTALLEAMGPDCLVRLSSWLEAKNVHHGQNTGNPVLDSISEIYWRKYHGQEIKIDQFINNNNNYQKFTIDPWAHYLHNSAVHFTNETLAYSYMYQDGREFIFPGPFLTEKTLKCLLAGTGFIPVGQYDTLGALSDLGCRFDYPFDTSWDRDPGNLSRLAGIIKLIAWFSDRSAQEIYEIMRPCAEHNFDLVWSGEFGHRCEIHNQRTIQDILEKYGK